MNAKCDFLKPSHDLYSLWDDEDLLWAFCDLMADKFNHSKKARKMEIEYISQHLAKRGLADRSINLATLYITKTREII